MSGITLRVLDGADRGRVFQNLPLPITIGREEGNAIQLNDERVSRYHIKIQEDHTRLVITDLGMPYVDGRKVASAIKGASSSTPVILLTGWGQRLAVEGDVPEHVDRILSKPPKLRELREALVQLCAPPVN